MKKIIVASVFASIFIVGQANAGGGQFSLYGGYLNPGDLNLDNIEAGLNLRSTSLYGARVEFDFLKIFGIEQNFGFSPRLLNSTLFPQQAADIRGFLYSTNGVVNIPLGRFVPYATAGLGLVKPWGTGVSKFDATFACNYGGGLKLNKLVGPVGLRFDVRGWRTADIASRGGVNILEASGGLTFTWSGN
jgi:hypothetical protein